MMCGFITKELKPSASVATLNGIASPTCQWRDSGNKIVLHSKFPSVANYPATAHHVTKQGEDSYKQTTYNTI